MSSSYSSLDWVLSHWAHFTVRRFICVYLCVFCVFLCHTAYVCCIIVSTVRWTWWDWSLNIWTYLSSVLWHCWLGHLTRKNPSPIWPIMCACSIYNSFACNEVQLIWWLDSHRQDWLIDVYCRPHSYTHWVDSEMCWSSCGLNWINDSFVTSVMLLWYR